MKKTKKIIFFVFVIFVVNFHFGTDSSGLGLRDSGIGKVSYRIHGNTAVCGANLKRPA
jgi:hypothetical protein